MSEPLPTLLDYFPPTDPDLVIVYLDDDLVAVDKQSGLLSVPGRHPSLWDSIRHRARVRWPTAEMVHRLDKDTSGILLVAFNKTAHARIAMQFEKRTASKSYIARVAGVMAEDTGTIDLPLMTDWDNKPRQKVDFETGRNAVTDWQVIAREPDTTRVRLYPRTGRTHQLRVHMKAIGHVILGDAFYAEGEALGAVDRLQLHAETLEIVHPTSGEAMMFNAPAPF